MFMTSLRPLAILPTLLAPALLLAQTAPFSPQTVTQLHGLDTSFLDTATAPCDNFYLYACGQWLARHPVPADHSAYGRGDEVADQNDLKLKAILEKAAAGGKPATGGPEPAPSDRTPNEQKIGDDYATCMDTEAITAKGMEPLTSKLNRIGWVFAKGQLPMVVARLSAVGVQPFFRFGSVQDAADATRQIAEFDQPGLGLPERGYYLRTDDKSKILRSQYLDHIARMFVIVGEPDTQARADAQAVLNFETELAKASMSNEERRDPHSIYHKTQFAAFEQILPAFNVSSFLHELGVAPVLSLNDATPAYFARLNQLIASTDLGTLKTFIRWNMLRSAPVLALPAAIDDETFHFYGQVLSGQPEQPVRWKRCVQQVDQDLGEALGQVYVAQYFSAEDKQRTLQLAQDVEAAMDRDIDQLSWMSDATKREAKIKLHAVTNKIGYPDTWLDYSSLTITRGDALGNAVRAAQFEVHRDLAKIGKPVDRGEWFMTPPTVNAYYNPQMNDVNFPAGILQPPYFDPAMDDAVNYGDAGGVIGHELTHAFDDEGRQFDAQGNLRDWWTPADAKKFTQRAECVVREYDGFVAVDDLHVNGKLTLGENLADLGGLRLAYLAYLQRAQEQHVDPAAQASTADGFTPAQRFFLSYAQGWCENTRPEAMRVRVETDPHAPEEYRVNGVVENLPEFQEAFACKPKQKMVAKDHCSIW